MNKPAALPYLCRDCRDSGLATYYYDPKAQRTLFTLAQHTELDRAYQDSLRAGTAVCDCKKGMKMGCRETMVTVGARDKKRTVLLYPRMENIRKLSGEIPEQLDMSFDPASFEEAPKDDPKLVPLPLPSTDRHSYRQPVRDPSGPQVERE